MKKSQLFANLASFKEALRDTKEWVSLCLIMEEEMAMDGSAYQVKVETLPLRREALVNVTRDPAISSPVRKNDLWICVFLNGDYNRGFLIQQISTLEDKIHPKSVAGETVVSSRERKKINLSNDPKANLDEPALLGKTVSEWLVDLIEQIKNLDDKVETLKSVYKTHVHGSSSNPPSLPIPASADPRVAPSSGVNNGLDTLKSDQKQDTLKSDLVFLQERGLRNSP